MAGGRLTGRLGKFSLGVLNIRTEREPASQSLATNFSVVRVKRDLLRRSSIGAIFTGRSIAQNGVGSNEAYGVDGAFAFYDNLTINTYWARTRTDGLSGEDTSYRGQLDYAGDRYGVQLEHIVVGDHFNPEVGFLRRDDMKRSFAQFRFSPRPASIKAVRKFSWTGSLNYIEDGAGLLETREAQGDFGIDFENSDRFDVGLTNTFEFLEVPFPQMNDALFQKRIDAAFNVEPFATFALKTGKARSIGHPYMENIPGMDIAHYIAKESWVRANADAMRRFKKVMDLATNHLNSVSKEERDGWIAKYTGMKPEIVAAVNLPRFVTDYDVESLRKNLELAVEFKLIKQPFDVTTMIWKP